MYSLPVDSIANIASFLPLREQVKTFPEFNNCLKKVEDKKKLIRRAVYNWRLDYIEGGWNRSSKADLKRFIPLIARKQLIEEMKSHYNELYQVAIRSSSFGEIIDQLDTLQRCRMLNRSRDIINKHLLEHARETGKHVKIIDSFDALLLTGQKMRR